RELVGEARVLDLERAGDRELVHAEVQRVEVQAGLEVGDQPHPPGDLGRARERRVDVERRLPGGVEVDVDRPGQREAAGDLRAGDRAAAGVVRAAARAG